MANKLEYIQSKISTKEKISRLIHYWNFVGKKIVFTNGCFDLLHRGHIEYLAKAAGLGDILIIGINSDCSVKRLKGSSRPIMDEYSRALAIAALGFVTQVIIFEEDTPYELIKLIGPDILVKGSDYKPEDIVGGDIVVKKKGGQIVTVDFVEGFSTSNILKKIIESHQ